mgnify:CR=1 FL=1
MVAVRKDHGPTVWRHAKSSAEEAQWIAQGVQSLHKAGVPYRAIAVLYRAHYASRSIEEAFLKARIPHTIYSGVPFFWGERKSKTLFHTCA